MNVMYRVPWKEIASGAAPEKCIQHSQAHAACAPHMYFYRGTTLKFLTHAKSLQHS